MTAKPTLGYPSRTEAVIGLRASGLSTNQIADRIGICASTVVALEHSAGRSKRRQRPSETLGRTVVFPVDVLESLRPHADRRGVSVNKLARELISTIVDEDMIDAVMDDACAISGKQIGTEV